MKLVLALVSGAEPGEGPVLRVSIYSRYVSGGSGVYLDRFRSMDQWWNHHLPTCMASYG